MLMRVHTRRPDWPDRLAWFLEARMVMPFAWGLNDCAMFAADWVRDCTGDDVVADLRGAYASSEAAAAVLARHGGLLAMVNARLPAYLHPVQAHRGDVVCIDCDAPDPPLDDNPVPMLGIVAGNGFYAAPGLRRCEYRPMAEVRHAFAVG